MDYNELYLSSTTKKDKEKKESLFKDAIFLGIITAIIFYTLVEVSLYFKGEVNREIFIFALKIPGIISALLIIGITIKYQDIIKSTLFAFIYGIILLILLYPATFLYFTIRYMIFYYFRFSSPKEWLQINSLNNLILLIIISLTLLILSTGIITLFIKFTLKKSQLKILNKKSFILGLTLAFIISGIITYFIDRNFLLFIVLSIIILITEVALIILYYVIRFIIRLIHKKKIYMITSTHNLKRIALTLLILGLLIKLSFALFYSEKVEVQPVHLNTTFYVCNKIGEVKNEYLKQKMTKICSETDTYDKENKEFIKLITKIASKEQINLKNKYELRNYLAALFAINILNGVKGDYLLHFLFYETALHIHAYNNSNIGLNLMEKCNLEEDIFKTTTADMVISPSKSPFHFLLILTSQQNILNLQEELLKCYKKERDNLYVKVETSEGKILYKPLKFTDPKTEKIDTSMILSDKDIDVLISMIQELKSKNKVIKRNIEKLYQYNSSKEDIKKKYEELKNNTPVPFIKLINAEIKDKFINITYWYILQNKKDSEYVFGIIKVKDLINNKDMYINCKITTKNNTAIHECSEKIKEISPSIPYEIEISREYYPKTFIIPNDIRQ